MQIGLNSIKEKRLDEKRIQKMNTQTDTRRGHSRVVNREVRRDQLKKVKGRKKQEKKRWEGRTRE